MLDFIDWLSFRLWLVVVFCLYYDLVGPFDALVYIVYTLVRPFVRLCSFNQHIAFAYHLMNILLLPQMHSILLFLHSLCFCLPFFFLYSIEFRFIVFVVAFK